MCDSADFLCSWGFKHGLLTGGTLQLECCFTCGITKEKVYGEEIPVCVGGDINSALAPVYAASRTACTECDPSGRHDPEAPYRSVKIRIPLPSKEGVIFLRCTEHMGTNSIDAVGVRSTDAQGLVDKSITAGCEMEGALVYSGFHYVAYRRRSNHEGWWLLDDCKKELVGLPSLPAGVIPRALRLVVKERGVLQLRKKQAEKLLEALVAGVKSGALLPPPGETVAGPELLQLAQGKKSGGGEQKRTGGGGEQKPTSGEGEQKPASGGGAQKPGTSTGPAGSGGSKQDGRTAGGAKGGKEGPGTPPAKKKRRNDGSGQRGSAKKESSAGVEEGPVKAEVGDGAAGADQEGESEESGDIAKRPPEEKASKRNSGAKKGTKPKSKDEEEPNPVLPNKVAALVRRLSSDQTSAELFIRACDGEARCYVAELQGSIGQRESNAWHECRLCPYKRFRQAQSLLAHVRKQHLVKVGKGGSFGVKHPVRHFMGFVRAKYDELPPPAWRVKDLRMKGISDKYRPGPTAQAEAFEHPVAETAKLVRSWNACAPRPKSKGEEFSKFGFGRGDFCPLVSEGGGRLLLRAHPDLGGAVRISSNTALSQSVLKGIAAEALCCQCRPMVVRQRMVARATDSVNGNGDGLAEMFPSVDLLGDVLERVYKGPTMSDRIETMRVAACKYMREQEDLSLDGTVKIMQSTLGQVPEGQSGPRRSDEERTLVSLKGRTGVVLQILPCKDEGFNSLFGVLSTGVPEEARGRVYSIATDNPRALMSNKEKLLQLYPNLRCVVEDLVHGKIRAEQHTLEKSSVVSTIVHEVCMAFFSMAPKDSGEKFRWGSKIIQAESEAALLGFDSAVAALDEDGARELFEGRKQLEVTPRNYGRLLACGMLLGKDLVGRKNAKGNTLASTLRNQAGHFSFLRNGAIRRSEMLRPGESGLGTAAVEAFHREVGAWGQRVWRQRASLLQVKARALLFLKLSSGFLRTYHTAGRPQAHVVLVCVSNQVRRDPEDLQLMEWSREQFAAQQQRRQDATDRERLYQKAQKERKRQLGLKRGVVFVQKERTDGRTARMRTFARRGQKREAKLLTKAAQRSKLWREKKGRSLRQMRSFAERFAVATKAPPVIVGALEDEREGEKDPVTQNPGEDKKAKKKEKAKARLKKWREKKKTQEKESETVRKKPTKRKPNAKQKKAKTRETDRERLRRWREKRRNPVPSLGDGADGANLP